MSALGVPVEERCRRRIFLGNGLTRTSAEKDRSACCVGLKPLVNVNFKDLLLLIV